MISLLVTAWMAITSPCFAFYNPQTGHWLNRDLLGEPGFEALRTLNVNQRSESNKFSYAACKRQDIKAVRMLNEEGNRYGFVGNTPISFVDSYGLAPTMEIDSECTGAQTKQLLDSYKAEVSVLNEAENNTAFTDNQKTIIKCFTDKNRKEHVFCGGCPWCQFLGNHAGWNFTPGYVHICSGAFTDTMPQNACLEVTLIVEMMKNINCLTSKDEYKMRNALSGVLCH